MSTKAIILNKQTYLPITNAASLLGKKVKTNGYVYMTYRDATGESKHTEGVHDLSGIVKYVSNTNEISMGNTAYLGYGSTTDICLGWLDVSDVILEIGGVISTLLTHVRQLLSCFFRKELA